MKYISVLLLSLTASVFGFGNTLSRAEIEPYIRKIIEDCEKASSGYAACPTVEKLTYTNLPIRDVKKIITTEFAYSLEPANDTTAISAFLPRIREYQNLLEEYDAHNAISYENATTKIIDILHNMSHGCLNETYIDENTYWGPSVNASAVIIINPIKETVHIFTIGDMDG